jgi:ribosome-associated protein
LTQSQDAEARAFALDAARIALELHCRDSVVLDLKGTSPATDFFVIATGTSDRQMRTVIDEISVTGKQAGFSRFGRAGYDQARWILLDFVNVVIHVFDSEYRDFYDLENLWGEAEQLELPALGERETEPGTHAAEDQDLD